MTAPKIIWTDGAYPGDDRRLAMVGQVAIGAIFLGMGRARFIRWRCWCTARMNPVEGTERGETAAKLEVEKRFLEFLRLAGMIDNEEYETALFRNEPL